MDVIGQVKKIKRELKFLLKTGCTIINVLVSTFTSFSTLSFLPCLLNKIKLNQKPFHNASKISFVCLAIMTSRRSKIDRNQQLGIRLLKMNETGRYGWIVHETMSNFGEFSPVFFSLWIYWAIRSLVIGATLRFFKAFANVFGLKL